MVTILCAAMILIGFVGLVFLLEQHLEALVDFFWNAIN